MKVAAARPEPIPVYAEMSSINPVYLLPEALKSRADAIATGVVNSMLMGSGQFFFLVAVGGAVLSKSN